TGLADQVAATAGVHVYTCVTTGVLRQVGGDGDGGVLVGGVAVPAAVLAHHGITGADGGGGLGPIDRRHIIVAQLDRHGGGTGALGLCLPGQQAHGQGEYGF